MLVVVAGVVLVVVLPSSPPARPPAIAVHTVFKTASVSSVVELDGRYYATDDLKYQLEGFDPSTKRIGATMKLPGRPVAMVTDAGKLWVASMVTDTVEEISTGPLKLVRKVSVPSGPSGLAVFDGKVWVASVDANKLSALDPTTGSLATPISLPAGTVRVTAGFGALWVTGTTDSLSEVQLRAGKTPTIHTIAVGQIPIGVAVGDGSVWVGNVESNTVSRIDPATRTVEQTVAAGTDPVAITVSDGRVWVADGSSEQLRVVYPSAGRPKPKDINSTPRELLNEGSGVWLATANPGQVLQASVGVR
jgi:YVTN family beta-propeller protein